MKKNLEKIFASCSIVVALILIMVLVVTSFGGIDQGEFDSKLVRGLIITLAILYLALATISLVLIFVNNDVVKEITLRQEKGGSVRVTANVVTKFVKTTCKQVEGVKCQKVVLASDEYGVRLKVNVKVVDRDVLEVETYLRTLLEDVFLGEFGFKFSSIEIKVMALTPTYKADQADVQAKVEKKLAEMKANEAKTDAKSDGAPQDGEDVAVEAAPVDGENLLEEDESDLSVENGDIAPETDNETDDENAEDKDDETALDESLDNVDEENKSDEKAE